VVLQSNGDIIVAGVDNGPANGDDQPLLMRFYGSNSAAIAVAGGGSSATSPLSGSFNQVS
jgi:hypothetical protein